MNEDVLGYLQQVRLCAESDVVNVARYHARNHKTNHGHFSTPRQVFCYVDHLGFIAFGGQSTPRSVRFIREYFPAQYGRFAALLHAMWRHGTVHQLKPYSYKAPLADGATLAGRQGLSGPPACQSRPVIWSRVPARHQVCAPIRDHRTLSPREETRPHGTKHQGSAAR